jgi:CheY-like chemotaxis protein
MGIANNADLSSKRAENVVNYLASHGVNPNLLSAQGMGDSNPVVPNDTPQGRASKEVHDAIQSYVRLSVSGTGTGMTPEVLARVTEPFFTTKGQGKGTGLGLAMARGFTEQSGGGLHRESAPGRGTTVKLWFPLAKGSPAMVGPLVEHAGGKRDEKRARLLVVDDDAMVREILTEQLEAAGYIVVAAANGAAALELLDAGEQVDLIVSDLSMPGMDGVALVRAIQRRRPHVPAILLTGFASNAAEVAVGGAISGAFILLRKPIEEKVLAERVAVLLDGVALR